MLARAVASRRGEMPNKCSYKTMTLIELRTREVLRGMSRLKRAASGMLIDKSKHELVAALKARDVEEARTKEAPAKPCRMFATPQPVRVLASEVCPPDDAARTQGDAAQLVPVLGSEMPNKRSYETMNWKELSNPEVLRGVLRQKRAASGKLIDKSKHELLNEHVNERADGPEICSAQGTGTQV